ncbi:NAD(P)-dependent oxidoreductase, partial [Streptomyces sp. NPDC001970]
MLIEGSGTIDTAVERQPTPFGCTLIRVSRRARTIAPTLVRGQGDLPSLVGHADVVVLCLRLTGQPQRLFDARLLKRMKDQALLVNVGRRGIVGFRRHCEGNSLRTAQGGARYHRARAAAPCSPSAGRSEGSDSASCHSMHRGPSVARGRVPGAWIRHVRAGEELEYRVPVTSCRSAEAGLSPPGSRLSVGPCLNHHGRSMETADDLCAETFGRVWCDSLPAQQEDPRQAAAQDPCVDARCSWHPEITTRAGAPAAAGADAARVRAIHGGVWDGSGVGCA